MKANAVSRVLPPQPHPLIPASAAVVEVGRVWRSIWYSLLYNIEGFKGATVVVIATRGAAPAHLVCTTTLGKPPMPVFFRSLLPAQLATRPPLIRAEVLPHVAGGVLELRHTPGTATAPWRDPLCGALQARNQGAAS